MPTPEDQKLIRTYNSALAQATPRDFTANFTEALRAVYELGQQEALLNCINHRLEPSCNAAIADALDHAAEAGSHYTLSPAASQDFQQGVLTADDFWYNSLKESANEFRSAIPQ